MTPARHGDFGRRPLADTEAQMTIRTLLRLLLLAAILLPGRAA